jgi:hypothetical protein
LILTRNIMLFHSTLLDFFSQIKQYFTMIVLLLPNFIVFLLKYGPPLKTISLIRYRVEVCTKSVIRISSCLMIRPTQPVVSIKPAVIFMCFSKIKLSIKQYDRTCHKCGPNYKNIYPKKVTCFIITFYKILWTSHQ